MKILAIIGIILLTGCTSPSDANKALSNAGYTKIQTNGYGWFVCGKDDFFATNFTAVNPNNQVVSGTVCSGLIFKGATIRF